MNKLWKIIQKINKPSLIKYLLRKKWGKYPCVCLEEPKSAMGVTVDNATKKVTHFWCSECGGYRKTQGKYRIEIENHKKGGCREIQ